MTRRSVLAAAVAVVAATLATVTPSSPVDAQSDDRAWLVLGDSYTSGEGIPGTSPHDIDNGINYHGKDCRRATGVASDAHAWAVRSYDEVADELGFATQMFVPCTGAETDAIPAQIAEAQQRANRQRWDLVTLSIGGNDIEFSEVVRGCLNLQFSWSSIPVDGCNTNEADLRGRVDNLMLTIGGTYDQIAQVVEPGGDVVVVGYPHLVEEQHRRPPPMDRRGHACEGIWNDDNPMLRSATGYLNEQLGRAVLDADARWRDRGVRFHFLDISQDPFEYSDDPTHRHGLCTLDPWLNGRTVGATSGDIRVERSFHPNQKGHDNIGRVLSVFLRDNVRFDDLPAGFGPSPFATPAEAALGYVDAAIHGRDVSNMVSLWSHDEIGELHLTWDNPAWDTRQLAGYAEPGRVVVNGPLSSQVSPEEGLYGPGCGVGGDFSLVCTVDYRTTDAPGRLRRFEVYLEPDPAGGYRVSGAWPEGDDPYESLTLLSPSGNIACGLSDGQARCDLRESNWSISPEHVPSGVNCEYISWGDSIAVEEHSNPRLVCHGDTTFGDPFAFTLDYGHSVAVGPMWCASTEAGMVCGSTTSGRSFRIARDSYELR